MRQLLLLMLSLNVSVSYASCGLSRLITGEEESDLQSKVKLEYVDKELFGSTEVDLITIQLPKYFKELEITEVRLTYWNENEVIYHANLGLSYPQPAIARYEKQTITNTYKFSVNRNLKISPALTVVYGSLCNFGYHFNVGELSNYNIGSSLVSESSAERMNSVFINSKNTPNKSLKRD